MRRIVGGPRTLAGVSPAPNLEEFERCKAPPMVCPRGFDL